MLGGMAGPGWCFSNNQLSIEHTFSDIQLSIEHIFPTFRLPYDAALSDNCEKYSDNTSGT